MSGVYALYDEGRDAQRAVDALRAAGLADSEITVITSAPMEEFEFSHIDGTNYIWYLASIGGLAGMLVSVWLTTFTATDWPINVGNMSIVAWWPFLVIVFELTMLGAILTTVVSLVVTAKLFRRRPALYDTQVTTDNKILVGIENPNDSQRGALERALLITPGVSLKTV